MDVTLTLFNTREAAQFLKLKPNTLEIWRVKGIGPKYYKFNGAVRYGKLDLEDYAKASIRTSTSDKGERA